MCWLRRTIHCTSLPFVCGDFAQVRNNCFHVDNIKQLFQDIRLIDVHIDSIMTFFLKNIFNKIQSLKKRVLFYIVLTFNALYTRGDAICNGNLFIALKPLK